MDASSWPLEAAACRRFTTPEIVDLLSPSTTPLPVSSRAPTAPPPSGSLFLYDRSAVRHYRQDGHDWVMKPVSSKRGTARVREDDVRLRYGKHYRVAAYYARSVGGALRRRTYWLIDPVSFKPENDLVLVHYLDAEKLGRAPKTDMKAHVTETHSMSPRLVSKTMKLETECSDHSMVQVEPERNELKETNVPCRGDGIGCQRKYPFSGMSQLPSVPGKMSAQQKALSAVSEFLSAPKMTEECMAEEWVSSSETERSAAIGDLYGNAATTEDPENWLDCSVHNNEFTNELQDEILTLKLSLMDDEIGRIPAKCKLGYLEAMQQCPHFACARHAKLQFLRCECFDPRAAAQRLAKYWDKRVEILGHDFAFLPLNLEGTMPHDHEATGFGFAKLLPGLDASGRAILFLDNTIHCTHRTALRAIWYMCHAALENESARREGFIMIVNRRPSPELINLQSRIEYQSLVRDIVPLQLRALHPCHWKTDDLSGWFVTNVIAALAFALGPRVRSRLVFHEGSKEKVLLQLAEYGILSHQLPTKMGGTFSDEDFQQWLMSRREAGL